MEAVTRGGCLAVGPHGSDSAAEGSLTTRARAVRRRAGGVDRAASAAWRPRTACTGSRAWVPACARAGLAGLGFHDLRRAAATVLVTSGVDVRTAQHRLGDSDPRLTLAVYAQVAPHADRAAAAAIEDHFLAGARDERAMDGSGVC
jgi:integrase